MRDKRPGHRRTMTLPVSEFIGCFMRHVLPPGFKRIRHDGLLATAPKRARLATSLAKPDNQAVMIKRHTPFSLSLLGGDLCVQGRLLRGHADTPLRSCEVRLTRSRAA